MNPFPQHPGMGQGMPQFPPMRDGDERLYVQFYMGSVQNAEKSAEAGHPVFDSKPFIKIMVPGDKNTLIDTVVGPDHKRRFARLWYQFEQSQSPTLEGFPIRDWPGITRAQADELVHLNILTVEHLAGCADVYGSRIMGFNDLRRRAQTFLQNAKDSALSTKLASENAQLKERIDLQDKELRRMSAVLEQVQQAQQAPPAAKGK